MALAYKRVPTAGLIKVCYGDILSRGLSTDMRLATVGHERTDRQLNGGYRRTGQPRLNRKVNNFRADLVGVRVAVNGEYPFHHIRVVRASVNCHALIRSK